ncbi:BatD family protein [Amaricoccus solimangrovi]|uniref:Protein BatD n=1 Tax=Amaricoccus solimangrovi TaxID=2589815 RepID=A0A501WSH9_9RHOB|nr:BatD family protein [Amaricoccus solimangrovi]TPE50237.1 protein BatD [Amaricoccus solimangrovi]
MVRGFLPLALLCATAARAEEGKSLTLIAAPAATPVIAGEMVPLTIRGVYDTEIALEKMEIAPSQGFDWIQLAPDDWHDERIGGVTRRVVERRLAIFPKTGGQDTFGPVNHHLTVIGEGSRREEITLRAQPVTLAVAPMPDDPPFEKPWGWRFAASKVTITDALSTDPAKLADGETVTRTVTFRAEGALPEMLPPRPVIQEPWLISFAAPVETKLERGRWGLASTAIWRWQFRPETGEPGVIAPIPIPYFNTLTRRVEAVEIPALPIGYASFKASQVPGGEMGAGARLAYLGALGLGLLAGLALSAGAVERRAGWWERALRHWSPAPLLRLRRAARSGDLLALRRAAEDYLTPEEARDPARRAAALDRLDAAIYGPDTAGFDAARLVRDLRRARRVTSGA